MTTKSKIFYWYIAFVIALIGLTILPAPDKATLLKYHLTATSLRALGITLVIPEAAIWLAAFYGSQRLSHYSQLIKKTADGRPIAKLARGLQLLAFGLPVTAILSGTLSLVAAHHPDFKSVSVVINSYLNVIFPLLAFIWIGMGARELSQLSRTRPSYALLNFVVVTVIILGVVFCCLLVLNHQTFRTTYHMSPELVMLTLGIPYIYIWFTGLFAVAELRAYSLKVRGVVYRQGWHLLIVGLGAIIFLSILLQYLTTLTSWLTALSLGGLLLLLYVLLIMLATAYIVVALGTKKLMKIEEA